MALSCLSIIVAKLTNPRPVGTELPDPTDPGSGWTNYFDDYIELSTVTRCKVTRAPVYDEGGIRILYHTHSVEIDAVLTNDQLYGELTEPGGDPDAYTFDEKLEIISNFLSNQGLGINFGNYPAAIKKLAPGNENRRETAEYTGNHGWLIDNMNGPLVDNLTFDPLVGDNTVKLNWTLHYKTFHTDIENAYDDSLIPKISSELRLDIDKDGDLAIYVDGTVYADSLKALYYARNWLELVYQPTDLSGIKVYSRGQQISEDRFAQVNGFLKTVKFNVEKNGRSARFSLNYTQVKSNNAFPLGLRDIAFKQSIESSLLGASVYSGKGFQSWKTSFKGKITIPPRLNAEYAWYIFHLLVQQQMRNTAMSFDSKVWKSDEQEKVANESEVSDEIFLKERFAKVLPLRLRIEHDHYSRELAFDIDFVIMCPLKHILAVSCILNRVNNDYQRRLTENDAARDYKPLKVSQQWWYWNRSVDLGLGFDPATNGANPFATGRPHRDGAGTEIIDTGHNYDPYLQLDAQSKQRNILITTVVDPNEVDPVYQPKDETQPSTSGYFGTELPDGYSENTNTLNEAMRAVGNRWKGRKPFNPIQMLTNSRGETPVFDERTTWIKYEQDYEIIETNNTIPVEGVADIDVSNFQSSDYATYSPGHSTIPEDDQLKPARLKGMQFSGRTVADTTYEDWVGIEDEEAKANTVPIFRKTYAAGPPRYYLVVRGTAMRVKYKIPMPQVISIAGKPATRVGEARFRHKNIAPDADLPVYFAMWIQTYTVDSSVLSEDILSQIIDTGASMLYA